MYKIKQTNLLTGKDTIIPECFTTLEAAYKYMFPYGREAIRKGEYTTKYYRYEIVEEANT